MPWEKQYDESRVLDLAMEAFWANGYEATSINDLVAATGINRGSLYHAFTDKRGLFLRALEHYDRQYREDFLSALARDHPPREAILAAFGQVVAMARSGRNRKGCLLVNTALEVSPHDPEVERIVKVSLEKVEHFFRLMIKEGQKEGTIRADLSAVGTARLLLSLFLGLRVITRSRPEKALMSTIARQAEALLD